MTVRARFVLGLASIAAVLLVPFLLALAELDSLRETTERMRAREFTAAQQLSRIRDAVSDLRTLDIRFLEAPNETLADSMRLTQRRLRALSDSLNDRVEDGALGLDSAVVQLGFWLDEYSRVALLGTPAAKQQSDDIFITKVRPAMGDVRAQLPELGRKLERATADRIEQSSRAAIAAQRIGLIGLLLATMLAAGIAIWLTHSISEPLDDFELAMRRVADGDLSYGLRTEKSAPAEFARLAHSYRTMVKQLAELDKLKAEVISVASHELKTPINVISGYTQLLQEGVYGKMDPKQLEVCRILEAQSQSLSRLVQQLLDVSRFEAGGGRLESRPIRLTRFVSELEESFTVLAIQRKVQFTVAIGDDLPEHVEWDEDRMSEVIGNLLSNAFRFTPADGTVELAVYKTGENVKISVSDTGAGIPASQLPHIFEKFFQADNQPDAPRRGTGLGLAIAREIVEAHQGEISVESIVGEGTRFLITLPVRAQGGRQVASRRRTPAMEVEVGA